MYERFQLFIYRPSDAQGISDKLTKTPKTDLTKCVLGGASYKLMSIIEHLGEVIAVATAIAACVVSL